VLQLGLFAQPTYVNCQLPIDPVLSFILLSEGACHSQAGELSNGIRQPVATDFAAMRDTQRLI
jgi:hypothetical protein